MRMSERDIASTSSSKSFGVFSYTYVGWCRLREVCCALKEMREKVAKQRQEIDSILKSEETCRENAAAVQAETVQLHSLQKVIERAKCRLMTVQLKLINVYNDKQARDKETDKRRNEILEMRMDIQKRTATLSLASEALSTESSRLILRRRKMLKELMAIYKIDLEGLPLNRILPNMCSCTSVATIAGLHLPDPRSLMGHAESEVATAAGYVVQLLILISQILNVSLRFPVTFQSSRSCIMNPISTEIFPLYSLARNREKFEDGLYHLNGNIAQLRSDCGLGTPNKYNTLANLHNLLLHLTVEDIEPKFLRPIRNVQSPSSVLRTSISDSVMLDHVKRISESRMSSTALSIQTVRSPNRCSSVDARSSSLLFDSSAIAALNLASGPLGTSSKVTHSDSMNGELIYS